MITTHVLDTARGRPAAGVPIVLERASGEGRHELSDVTVDVMLDGDFRAAHDEGDNSALIATDTMRNSVYVLAAKHDVSELEIFGRALVEHFVVAGPTVQRAQVRLVAHPW